MASKSQKTITVAVGSTNPVKIRAANQAFKAAFGNVNIISVEVPSGVRDQPLSRREGLKGALNRAIAAQKQTKADYGVGIEGSVHRLLGRYFTGSAVAIVNSKGVTSFGSSPAGLELPPLVARKMVNGKELGPVMDELLGIKDSKKKFGAVGKLTGGLVLRHQAYAMGIKIGLAKFVRPEFYREK